MKFNARITGNKKLMKQISDLPEAATASLQKSMINSAKYGARKARSIVPVDTGDLRDGIEWNFHKGKQGIFAFVNFVDGTKERALKVGAVNYGRQTGRVGTGTRLRGTVASTGQTSGYHFIETVKLLIGKRHTRSVKRNLDKALKQVMK